MPTNRIPSHTQGLHCCLQSARSRPNTDQSSAGACATCLIYSWGRLVPWMGSGAKLERRRPGYTTCPCTLTTCQRKSGSWSGSTTGKQAPDDMYYILNTGQAATCGCVMTATYIQLVRCQAEPLATYIQVVCCQAELLDARHDGVLQWAVLNQTGKCGNDLQHQLLAIQEITLTQHSQLWWYEGVTVVMVTGGCDSCHGNRML